jgi:hypothetical protein
MVLAKAGLDHLRASNRMFRLGLAQIECSPRAGPSRRPPRYRGILMPRCRIAPVSASRIVPLIWKGFAATCARPVRRKHASARGSSRRWWNGSVVAVHSLATPCNSHRFQENTVNIPAVIARWCFSFSALIRVRRDIPPHSWRVANAILNPSQEKQNSYTVSLGDSYRQRKISTCAIGLSYRRKVRLPSHKDQL